MDRNEVRAGIQQAKAGDAGFGVLMIQSLLLAAIAGVRLQSWAVGIVVLLAVLAVSALASKNEKASAVVAFVFGVCWASVGFLMFDTPGAQIAAAVLLFLIGFGGNALGMRAVADLERKEPKV